MSDTNVIVWAGLGFAAGWVLSSILREDEEPELDEREPEQEVEHRWQPPVLRVVGDDEDLSDE